MQSIGKIFAIAVAAALSGCATSDLHRPAVQVLFTTPDSIKLEWDEYRFTEQEAQAQAVAYCKGRNVQIVDSGRTLSPKLQNRTWRCA